jgi:hypothetical protein
VGVEVEDYVGSSRKRRAANAALGKFNCCASCSSVLPAEAASGQLKAESPELQTS